MWKDGMADGYGNLPDITQRDVIGARLVSVSEQLDVQTSSMSLSIDTLAFIFRSLAGGYVKKNLWESGGVGNGCGTDEEEMRAVRSLRC